MNKFKVIDRKDLLISIVVPAFNEEEVLYEFHQRLSTVTEQLSEKIEIVYVNDGSIDNTQKILRNLRKRDPRVSIVDLSRNFGKEIAMTAGIDNINDIADAVIIIDADLQDPPALIPELIRHWKSGYDVVYAQRTRRYGESVVKKMTAKLFYSVITKIKRVNIPENTGDFRLLSRRAVVSLKQLKERHRFMKGLFSWIGFPQKAVPYRRDPRYSGKTKWNYWRLWNFAIEGITSFTTTPLKIGSYIGLVTALGSFIYGLIIIIKKMLFGNPVPGYPSLMVIILFLGGIQLICIGIMGEYIGRIFNETKNRPLYLVKGYEPAKDMPNKPVNIIDSKH